MRGLVMSDKHEPGKARIAHGLSRREFLAAGGGAVALSLVPETGCCSTGEPKLGTHHIPEDKGLADDWARALFARGESKAYRGDELNCIGMPIGGICAGQ